MLDSVVEELGAVLDVVFGDGEVDLVGAEDPLSIPVAAGSVGADVIGRFAKLFEELRNGAWHVFGIMDTPFDTPGSFGDFFFNAFDFAETTIEGDLADFVGSGSFGLAWENGDAPAVFFELLDLFVGVVFFDGD